MMDDKLIKINILLIEDNPGDVDLLREMLIDGRTSFELIWVEELSMGLKRLDENNIDVILLDLSLPDSEGLSTFTEVYTAAPHIPIVVLTGLNNDELAAEAVRKGAQDYLVKSNITGNLLRRTIRYAIERKRIEAERIRLTNELREINQTLDEMVQDRTAELKAILDAVDQGIVVTDINGAIQYINPAQERLLGYSKEETLGKTTAMWKSNRHSDVFYAQMWQTIISGQIWRGEMVNKHKNGTLYDVFMSITPILNSDGLPRGFVGVQNNITLFKEMDKIKSEFLSTAAHELKTPLTSIQGFSEILLTRKLDEERKNNYLSFINKQGEVLATIINDLLDLSRMEAGQSFDIEKEEVNIKEIIEETIFGFRENYTKHKYSITGTDSYPLINGDRNKLAQLFKNLIGNATKYSPNGGDITVQVIVQEEYHLLHLTLADQGIGMTAEQLHHVFERFYRADASNTAIGGTGLGMSISRLIVDKHDGRIWLESSYGVGTTVHILLPLPNRPAYLLIIDNQLPLPQSQQLVLEENGFTTVYATEGDTGLQLAFCYLPCIILLELTAPGINGIDILEQLKAHHLTDNIPVIITSNISKQEVVERVIKNGATDYLVKPYSPDDLRVRVKLAISKNS